MTEMESRRADDALRELADQRFATESLYEWGSNNETDDTGGLGACLGSLLVMLGWRGDVRHLEEARPHMQPVATLDDMRSVLFRLGYQTTVFRGTISREFDGLLPYLFIDRSNKPVLLCERDGDGELLSLDGDTRKFTRAQMDGQRGTLMFAGASGSVETDTQISKFGWFSHVVSRLRSLILKVVGLSLLTNLSNLLVPLFIMVVYDNIVRTGSTQFLGYLAAGIGAILLFDLYLRHMRGRALAYIGARLDALIAVHVFRQLMNLPIQMVENVPISTQLAKIKQFENIGETIVGRLAPTVFDLPFGLLFLIVIWGVGGSIVWVPVLLILAYAVLAAATIPVLNRRTSAAGEQLSQQQHFLIELIARQRAIKEALCEDIWRDRFNRIVSKTLAAQFQVRQINRIIEILAQTLATSCGALTLLVGSFKVMAGDMSVGALIAVMALVWRVLGPVQSTFVSFNHIGRVRQNIRHLDNLLRMNTEPREVSSTVEYRTFQGDLVLDRLSLRYGARSEASLANVSLSASPGELIAITGPSGSGKSTLLHVIAGLYAPQAGVVLLDGLDIRQINVSELRHGIGILPQSQHFFYGTVLQNIRLAAPGASMETIKQALIDADLSPDLSELPEGLETRLTFELIEQLPQGLIQRLHLARVYAKNIKLLLLDVPAQGLDERGDLALLLKLKALQGQCTVVMVTHRPDHMRLADKVVVMDRGSIVAAGKPDEILKALSRAA